MGALAAACVASCGAPAAPDLTGTTSSPIQGGTTDTTHTFAVGVVEVGEASQNMVAFCSGVLLAPNLVATARHCVAELSSTTIDCTSSTFGPLYPTNDVYVTKQTTITMNGLVGVSKVIVPTNANQTSVCGNDIALLILDTNIDLPQYAMPVIDPPMTDPQYEPVVSAIGYGVDTPTDTQGTSAGTRRIKEDVSLLCIPNDTTFTDCFSDPTARQILTAGEFVSGDSTCEGDSGSGAFEQGNFDKGKWDVFGILSRGGVSTDGQTCEQPIYTRFDAWGSLIVDAAQQAAQQATAQKASYSLPAWAGGLANDAGAATQAACTSSCDDGGDQATGGKSSGGCSVSSGADPSAPAREGELAVLGLLVAAAAVRSGRGRKIAGRGARACTVPGAVAVAAPVAVAASVGIQTRAGARRPRKH
jgi:MYXO-CTERM domain-containing protein